MSWRCADGLSINFLLVYCLGFHAFCVQFSLAALLCPSLRFRTPTRQPTRRKLERQQRRVLRFKTRGDSRGKKAYRLADRSPFLSSEYFFRLPSRLLLRGSSEGECARAKERKREKGKTTKGSIKNKLGKHKRVCAGGNTRALKLPPFLSLRTRAYRYDARG